MRQARYITNIPPPAELTPPPTAAGHPASASTSTLLLYLTSTPTPSIQRAREAFLEYVLNREARLREKRPGRGGKGTLGREGFEEIAGSLAEIEDGLRGTGILAEKGIVRNHFVPDEELDSARQLGLALVLSLRMLLSYFTLPELARQILALPPGDAERTLVQHIRRRVGGEGRYAVARELEHVESLVSCCHYVEHGTDLSDSEPPSRPAPRLPFRPCEDSSSHEGPIRYHHARSVQVSVRQATVFVHQGRRPRWPQGCTCIHG